MSKPKLLACPFCGHEPLLVNLPGSVFYKVICDRTSCQIRVVDTGLKDSRAKAIAAWNRRAWPVLTNQHSKWTKSPHTMPNKHAQPSRSKKNREE